MATKNPTEKPKRAATPRRRVPTEKPPEPLTLAQKNELRQMLNSTTFTRALEIIQSARPGAFSNSWGTAFCSSPKPIDPQSSMLAANNRLHEMKGWDLYQAALFNVVAERIPAPPIPTETFPNEGLS